MMDIIYSGKGESMGVQAEGTEWVTGFCGPGLQNLSSLDDYSWNLSVNKDSNYNYGMAVENDRGDQKPEPQC